MKKGCASEIVALSPHSVSSCVRTSRKVKDKNHIQRFEFRLRIPSGCTLSDVYLHLNTITDCKCWQTNPHFRFGHDAVLFTCRDYFKWQEKIRPLIPDISGNTMPDRFETTGAIADCGILMDINQMESTDFSLYESVTVGKNHESRMRRLGLWPIDFEPRKPSTSRTLFVEYQVDCCNSMDLLKLSVPTTVLRQLVKEYAFYPALYVGVGKL